MLILFLFRRRLLRQICAADLTAQYRVVKESKSDRTAAARESLTENFYPRDLGDPCYVPRRREMVIEKPVRTVCPRGLMIHIILLYIYFVIFYVNLARTNTADVGANKIGDLRECVI